MSKWPHDDTDSLVDFYGDPDTADFAADNIVGVYPPFHIFYEGKPWNHPIQIHRKCASALKTALDDIWEKAKQSQAQINKWGISNFSGSFVPRNIRGGRRKSCHAFGAAVDWDAENLPLGSNEQLPDAVANAFEDVGAFLGENFKHRKDPMHIQFANEDTKRADAEQENQNQIVAYDEDHVAPPIEHADYRPSDDEQPKYWSDRPEDKPLVSSKIAKIGAAVGTTGGGVAYGGYTDAALEAAKHAGRHHQATIWMTLQHLMHQPLFWVGIAIVAGAALIVYYRWRDHGKGRIF